MKRNSIAGLVALIAGFGAAGAAEAQCPAGLTTAQLISTLSGKYACARRQAGVTPAPGCGNPNDTWNELHQGSQTGQIIDYKRGPTDPVDPSKPVGTYTINANDTVTYNYGGSCGPYTYTLRQIPSPNPESPAFQYCNIATNEMIPAIISTSPTHTFCSADSTTGASTGGRVPSRTSK